MAISSVIKSLGEKGIIPLTRKLGNNTAISFERGGKRFTQIYNQEGKLSSFKISGGLLSKKGKFNRYGDVVDFTRQDSALALNLTTTNIRSENVNGGKITTMKCNDCGNDTLIKVDSRIQDDLGRPYVEKTFKGSATKTDELNQEIDRLIAEAQETERRVERDFQEWQESIPAGYEPLNPTTTHITNEVEEAAKNNSWLYAALAAGALGAGALGLYTHNKTKAKEQAPSTIKQN